MEREYYKEIDIIKGIAILLVILGHSFCNFPFDLGSQCPQELIEVVRSFQMPLFFMASGFLFSWRGTFLDFVKNKARRLLIPYLVFGIVSLVLKISFSSITRSGEIDVLTGLIKIITGVSYWFLYSLSLIMLVMRFAKKSAIRAILALLSMIICLVTNVQDISIFTLGRSVYYLFFFVCGIIIKELYPLILLLFESPMRGGYCAILLLIYILSLMYGKHDPTHVVEKYLLPLSGSCLTWGLSIIWSRNGYFSKFMGLLIHFGKYSLQYYLNHLLIMLPIYYMVYFFHISYPLVSLLLIFFMAVAVSWIMLRIEMRIPVMRKLCGLKS